MYELIIKKLPDQVVLAAYNHIVEKVFGFKIWAVWDPASKFPLKQQILVQLQFAASAKTSAAHWLRLLPSLSAIIIAAE